VGESNTASQAVERLAEFRRDLDLLPSLAIVRRHITFGQCFVLDDHRHFSLKAEVAEHFHIHPNEVVVVGSGKLGFSIADEKRYRVFGDSSDIDVAIVSASLFDCVWQMVFDYWTDTGGFDLEEDFRGYLFRGWIRPDKLPPTHTFRVRKDWWEFFRRTTSHGHYGPHKVRGALFRTWHFLETYQEINVRKCQQDAGV